MRALFLAPFALIIAFPAAAQAVIGAAQGQYGSASDPALSCATNPHELGFIESPPHMVLTWGALKNGPPGQPRLREVYDLEALDDTSLTLREEGDYRPDSDGQGRFWVLQLTQKPAGYCWRRPDWPVVRCEDQQLRCENATS